MSKRHLEFKINYLRYRISLLPHGYFGSFRHREVVYVYFDPDNAAVNRKNQKRYALASGRGQALSGQIKEYVELKGQLDLLLKEWKLQYIGEPRVIGYPLFKRRVGPLDYEYFCKAVPNQAHHPDDKAIDHKGYELLSKNEEVVALILENMGYPYKSGVHLDVEGYADYHPDFLFYVPEIDKVFLIEVDGALDQKSYVSKSYYNTAVCLCNGFIEMKDFIVIRIGHGHEINSQQIESMIWAAIDMAIDDIVEV